MTVKHKIIDRAIQDGSSRTNDLVLGLLACRTQASEPAKITATLGRAGAPLRLLHQLGEMVLHGLGPDFVAGSGRMQVVTAKQAGQEDAFVIEEL